tara:strand:- start:43 stop:717 length:675 start_codon:yes stop_codon:yes gene_type:complete
MKILELFSGSRSIGKVAEKYGMEVFSVDNTPYPNTNYVGDILDFNYFATEIPNFLWASPPCTSFSVASISKHWIKGEKFMPKTEQAQLGIKILEKTIEIIKYYLELNPNLLWFIENPRGKMRKYGWENLPFDFKRETVMYCQYGDNRMKPTDLWTNTDFIGKKCSNYKYDSDGNIINRHCHHDSAQRGSVTGTQGLKGNHERSKIPTLLCEEVIKCLISNHKQK